MDEYKRRRRRSRAVMSMFLDSLGGSIDNVDVAEFDSDGSDLKALIVGIEPIQDLNGYDNPWPAGGGKNKININREPVVFSKNPGDVVPFEDGDLIKCVSRDGYFRNTVTYTVVDEKTFTVENSNSGYGVGFVFTVTPGETYTWSATYTDGGIDISYYDSDKIISSYAHITVSATSGQITIPANAAYAILILRPNAVNVVTTFSYVQWEKGSTAPTAWTPYANICPISGHSSVNVIVSPTLNPLDGTITNIPLGGTYYGGQLDVLTGVLTVTHANISSYNGEAINEPWISSMDAYSSGDTPTTGAQVVYPLATPTTIQLTGQQIATFLGTNHVWCDSGKIIHLEY